MLLRKHGGGGGGRLVRVRRTEIGEERGRRFDVECPAEDGGG